jgi:hypothetical protein
MLQTQLRRARSFCASCCGIATFVVRHTISALTSKVGRSLTSFFGLSQCVTITNAVLRGTTKGQADWVTLLLSSASSSNQRHQQRTDSHSTKCYWSTSNGQLGPDGHTCSSCTRGTKAVNKVTMSTLIPNASAVRS